MPDRYPQDIEIEIDRARLCRYLRLQAALAWFIILVIFSSFIAIGSVSVILDRKGNKIYSLAELGQWWAIVIGISVVSGSLLTVLVYLIFNHFSSKRSADSLHVSVEGQYLRVIQGTRYRRDRKLHFRSIVDYTCYQGPLTRYCGIMGI